MFRGRGLGAAGDLGRAGSCFVQPHVAGRETWPHAWDWGLELQVMQAGLGWAGPCPGLCLHMWHGPGWEPQETQAQLGRALVETQALLIAML